jgi:hypothetical protein
MKNFPNRLISEPFGAVPLFLILFSALSAVKGHTCSDMLKLYQRRRAIFIRTLKTWSSPRAVGPKGRKLVRVTDNRLCRK